MSSTINLNTLVDEALDEGLLSQEVSDIILQDVGDQIEPVLGALIDDDAPPPPSKLLIGLKTDNSWSMAMWPKKGPKNYISVMNHIHLITDTLLAAGVEPTDAELLLFLLNENPGYVQSVTGDPTLNAFRWMTFDMLPNFSNPPESFFYNGTPLMQRTTVFLGAVLAQAAYYQLKNIPFRSVSGILGDGDSTELDKLVWAEKSRELIKFMRSKKVHRVVAFGVQGEPGVNFHDEFKLMGVPEHDIDVVDGNPEKIADMMLRFSTLASNVSSLAPGQNAASVALPSAGTVTL